MQPFKIFRVVVYPKNSRISFRLTFNQIIRHTIDSRMINIASKAGNYLRATNQVVASGLRPLAGAAVAEKKKVVTEKQELSTVWAISKTLPAQNVSVKSGVTCKYLESKTSRCCPLFIYVFSMVLLKII